MGGVVSQKFLSAHLFFAVYFQDSLIGVAKDLNSTWDLVCLLQQKAAGSL